LNKSKSGIGAVILGAGFARRFGSDKRLALLGSSTVAETTLAIYAGVFDDLRLVVREEDAALAELAAPYAKIIKTDKAHLGMGHSLAAGFQELWWQWAFVGLLDMPFVQAATLNVLKQHAALTDKPIIRPRLQASKHTSTANEAHHGHPIGFHESVFSAVAIAQGDAGARNLLRSNSHKIEDVLVSDGGIVRDIDHPDDLAQI
jgi:molybdenum cofactor cytidylyltransferase